MGIKLNFWRRLSVNGIYALAVSIMFALPAFLGIKEIYSHVEFIEGNKIKLTWAIAGLLIMSLFAVLYIKWFRKWFRRKLIGLQVRDEIGVMPVKGIVGIVLDRLLRTLEFVFPFFITLIVLYVSKYMFGSFTVFNKLFDMNVSLLYFCLVGFGIFLVGDFVKVNLMTQQEVDDKLCLESRANNKQLRDIKRASKRALKALEIERQLALLKETTETTPVEEPEEIVLPEVPEEQTTE